MIETYHPTPKPVPDIDCEHCGKHTTNQAYSMLLARPRVTREWVFCSLTCLRSWIAPIR